MLELMTTRSIRIPDEIDALLIKAADEEHISVNSAVVQAVEEWTRLRTHRARVQAITAQVIAEDAELLDRLADA
jgi:predicted transcriptional regulator